MCGHVFKNSRNRRICIDIFYGEIYEITPIHRHLTSTEGTSLRGDSYLPEIAAKSPSNHNIAFLIKKKIDME